MDGEYFEPLSLRGLFQFVIIEFPFVRSLWLVFLADRILLYGPLNSKACFIVKMLLKENETLLKGKVANEGKEQNSEAEMPYIPLRHKTRVKVQFVKI